MSKTLLNMLNDVQVNLREDQSSTISGEYDNLLVSFINQAKSIVEDAWDWHALREPITWTAVASQTRYDLTATTDNAGDADVGSNVWLAGRSRPFRLAPLNYLLAYDTTNNPVRLTEVPYAYGIDQQTLNNGQTGNHPYQIFFDSGGVNFVVAPDNSSNTYKIVVVTPQDTLVADSDTLTVPWRPVVTLATAWAANERGEELGNRPALPMSVLTTDWALAAEADLARAIALDSNLDPCELVMDAGQILWQGGI